jgi:MFS family permease
MKVKLSTLWVFVMFNVLAADILSFMNPGFLEEVMTGYAGEVHITQGFLLVAAILLEIPIAMIFLSRVFSYRANRWANIIAGAVTIAFVIGGGAWSYPHYVFLASIEVVCLSLIVWHAWRWPEPEGSQAR